MARLRIAQLVETGLFLWGFIALCIWPILELKDFLGGAV